MHENNPDKTRSGYIVSPKFSAPPPQLIYSVVSLLLQADFYCIFNVGVGSLSVSVTDVFGKS